MEWWKSMLIHGITITLYEKTASSERDELNRPVPGTVNEILVDNVLVQPLSEQEVTDTMNLTGRKAVYQLCLPKGDQHEWADADVSFFGKRWHVIGDVLEYIESMVPLSWNKQIRVEQIDG